MLVLSRKKEETIVIGDNIEIKVLLVERNVVKLGIKAPKHIRIVRSELLAHESSPVTGTNKSNDCTLTTTLAQLDDQVNSSIEDLTPFVYSADYMAEVEDQLLCVLGS